MALIFDPHQASTDMRNSVGNVVGAVAMAKVCNEWLAKITAERRAQGVDERNLFAIPVANRIAKAKDGRLIVRTINVSPTYAGKINNMEQLLTGAWRLATVEEVEAEADFQAQSGLNQLQAEIARQQKIQQNQTLQILESANHAEKIQREQLSKKAKQVKKPSD